MSDLDTEGCCPTCGRPTPRDYGQNRETDERAVEGALRARFNEEWRKLFPKGHHSHHPRSWTAEGGYVVEIVRELLAANAHDVALARNAARILAQNVCLPKHHWDGRPRSWKAISRDIGRFSATSANPARERRDAAHAAAYQAKMKRAEAEAAHPDVGRAALAALKGR